MITKNYKLLLLLIILLSFNSCKKEVSKSNITIDNLEAKINEAISIFESNDNLNSILPIFFFVEDNKIEIESPCVKAKYFYLKRSKNLFIYHSRNKSEEVLKLVNEALLILKNCNDYEIKGLIYNLIGMYYDTEGDFFLAKKNYMKSIFFFKKIKNKNYIIDSYFNLSKLDLILFNYNESLKNAEEAIKIIKEKSFKKSRLKFLKTFKSLSHINLGNYDLAEETLNLALKETKSTFFDNKLETEKALKKIYNAFSLLYKKREKYDLAFKYLKSSDSLNKIVINNTNNKINNLLDKEFVFNNRISKRNQVVIFNQKIILFGGSIFLLIGIYFLIKICKISRKLKITLEEKTLLNNQLKSSLIEEENSNLLLLENKKEIETLLRSNEDALFNKTFKISTYIDAINNVITNITKLIEKEDTIHSSKLLFINRKLSDIISEEEIWVEFKNEFEKNRPYFFDKLLEKCPTLSTTEQKHCSYIAINIKSKEVASIVSLSPRSVETARYRIKKKLGLIDESLSDFLQRI